MRTLIALLCLALATAAYVYINAIVVGLMMRYALPPVMSTFRLLLRLERSRLKRFLRMEARALSSARIWWTVGMHVMALLIFVYTVLQPLSLLALATLLFGFSFIVIAPILSLLKQMPSIRRLWDDTVVRLALLAFPAYMVYVARGYANVWVGEVLGVSASNASSALFAASVFLLCAVPSLLLLIAAIAFELALLAVPSALPKGSEKRIPLMVLFGSSLIALMAANEAVTQPLSSRVGNRLIAAIAFEFDAAPANHCELTEDEKPLVVRDEPFIKALNLSTAQDKALLVKRGPTLYRSVVLRDLRAMDVKALLEPIRMVECFKLPQSTPADPS